MEVTNHLQVKSYHVPQKEIYTKHQHWAGTYGLTDNKSYGRIYYCYKPTPNDLSL